jgi:hypothetical protein
MSLTGSAAYIAAAAIGMAAALIIRVSIRRGMRA